MSFDEDSNYYEPGPAEEILAEFTEKMQGILTDTAKQKIATLEAQIENLLRREKECAEAIDVIRAESATR